MTKLSVAFITGITGQDGSYLTELLLEKNYIVHGLIRRSSTINTSRIDHLINNPNLKLHYGDLTDGSCLFMCLSNIKTLYPDMYKLEIYNLAAQSHVKVSFEMPEYTADSDAFGTLKLLEAIRANNLESKCRFYQASTSELYGLVQEVPQKKQHHFIQDHHMELLSYTLIGSLKIIEKHIICLHVMVFCLIMNQKGEVIISSLEK